MKFNFSIKTLALVSAMGLGMLAPVHADDDETPLAKEMDVISGSLKKLRKAETIDEKVTLVQAAQASAIKGLEYVPIIFKDIKDEEEKKKATADYKMMTGQLFVKLCALESAYLNGDEDKALEIQGELKDLKKEGHRKYTD